MTETLTYDVVAFNTATASDNKIHSDDVASSYGFAGGLVPGVDVYAYLTHLPVASWGTEWLRSGSVSARFVHPVYDGDTITVTGSETDGSMRLEVTDSKGVLCAQGEAIREAADEMQWVDLDQRALPPDPPPATAESLAEGTVLGAFGGGFHAAKSEEYLGDVREGLALYREEGIAHPGWLLRFANWVLSHNVRLGPWIHVGSVARFLDLVHDGEHVEARGVVTGEYERGGHRFVDLDVAITAGGRPVQRVAHTAIYQPRRGPKT